MTLPTPGSRRDLRNIKYDDEESEDEEEELDSIYPKIVYFSLEDKEYMNSLSSNPSPVSPATPNSGGEGAVSNLNGSLSSSSGDALTSPEALCTPTTAGAADPAGQQRPKLIMRIKLPTASPPKRDKKKIRHADKKGQFEEKPYSKQDSFLKYMAAWYTNLAPSKKEILTRTIVKRRAYKEAFDLDLPVEEIPTNWLETLESMCGLQMVRKLKKYERSGAKMESNWSNWSSTSTPRTPTATTSAVNALDKKLLPRLMNNELSFTSCGRTVKTPRKFGIQIPSELSKGLFQEQVIPPLVGTSTPKIVPKEEVQKDENKQTSNRTTKPKQIVDLLDQPPPGWWFKKYNDTGIAPPREQTVYSTDDKTILFYDYNLPHDFYSSWTLNEQPQQEGDGDGGAPPEKCKLVKYAHEGNGFVCED